MRKYGVVVRVAVVVLGVAMSASRGAAQEKSSVAVIQPTDVPVAVFTVIKQVLPEAKITKASKGRANNDDRYSLELAVGERQLKAEVDVEDDGDVDGGEIEERISVNDMPATPTQAAHKFLGPDEIGETARSGGGRMVNRFISLDGDDFGAITYEWKLRNPTRRYLVSDDGKTVRVREEITEAALPKPTLDSVRKKHPQGDLGEIEKVTENGRFSYWMKVKMPGDNKAVEITVPVESKTAEKP